MSDGRGHAYRKARAALLERGPLCVWCRERPATTADHVPPLASAPSPELWVGDLVPACATCNYARGGRMTRRAGVPVRSRTW